MDVCILSKSIFSERKSIKQFFFLCVCDLTVVVDERHIDFREALMSSGGLDNIQFLPHFPLTGINLQTLCVSKCFLNSPVAVAALDR